MRAPRTDRDLLQAELEALLDDIESEHPELLEDAKAVLLFARSRAERLGGSTEVAPADIDFILGEWRDVEGFNSPHELGYYPETLYRLLGWARMGRVDGRERYRSIVAAVLRGELTGPLRPLRCGERPARFVEPDVGQRVCELVLLLGTVGEHATTAQ